MNAKTENLNEVVLQGNEACAKGALYAGCRFFAGYPITPSTEIIEMMSGEMQKAGGRFYSNGRRNRFRLCHHRCEVGRKQGDDGDIRTRIYVDAGGNRFCCGNRNTDRDSKCAERRSLNGSAYPVITAGHLPVQIRKSR